MDFKNFAGSWGHYTYFMGNWFVALQCNTIHCLNVHGDINLCVSMTHEIQEPL